MFFFANLRSGDNIDLLTIWIGLGPRGSASIVENITKAVFLTWGQNIVVVFYSIRLPFHIEIISEIWRLVYRGFYWINFGLIFIIVFDIVVLNSSRLPFHMAIWSMFCYGFCSSFPSNWHTEMFFRRAQKIKLSNIKIFFQTSTLYFITCVLICVLNEDRLFGFRLQIQPITD